MKLNKGTLFVLPLLFAPALVLGCGAEDDPAGTGDGDNGAGGTSGDGDVGSGGQGSGGAGTGGLGSGGLGSGGLGSGGLGTGGQGSGGLGSGGSGTGGEGTGGDQGTGGEMGTGGSAPVGSEGCGMDAGQALASWVGTTVEGGRAYDVWLPNNYDSMRPYPVILLLHGCGGFDNNIPLQNQSGEDAIVIRGRGSGDGTCWDNNADLPYIDDMIEDVEARFCVNADAIFAAGYSSGSWLASMLSCQRADVFRGIGSVAGGWPGGSSDCNGQVGRIFVHDTGDNSNQIANDITSRDIMIENNNCETATTPIEPSPCVEYNGCDDGYPVVWCQTTGEGHNRQDQLAAPLMWRYFEEMID